MDDTRTGAVPVAAEQNPAGGDPAADAPPAPGAVGGFIRMREERMMLLVGFGTGLLIGVFFLTYIILAIVSGEQTNFAPHSLGPFPYL